MGCNGRSFAVEGFRRRNRLCMGCSGRSFAAEGSRRGKPVKSRVANFSKERTILLRFSGCGNGT